MDRPWGRWTRLYMDDQVELRKLEVVEGGYCTQHYHEHQSNHFRVVQGVLAIICYTRDGLKGSMVRITTRDCVNVSPNVVHRFHAETPVVAYELNVATGPNPLDPNDSIQLGEAGVGELPP